VDFRTPLLLDSADKYTARLLAAPFSVDLSAKGEGPKAIAAAQRMENFDYQLMAGWMRQGVFKGPLHDMCGVTGQGWVHQTLNRAILPIIPEREELDDEAYLKAGASVLAEFASGDRADLFQVQPVTEPETIYYNADKSLILMRSQVPLAPLQRQYAQDGAGGLYGEKGRYKAINESGGVYNVQTIEGGVFPEGSNSGRHAKNVLLYIVETPDYCWHFIQDSHGSTTSSGNNYPQMHVLGCYKNVFGSPGFIPINGRETGHPSPQFSVHPLTHGALALAPIYNVLNTIVYSGGVYGEMTRIMLRELPGPEAAAARATNKNLEIELVGERVLKPPDGYEVVQPNIGVNKDTLNAAAALEIQFQRSLYPPELGEPASTAASSGYQQAVQRDTVANLLDPPLGNFAAACKTLLDRKDEALKRLKVDVTYVTYAPAGDYSIPRDVQETQTLKVDDVVEVNRRVSFDSLTQYARQSKIELGESLLEKGRITEDMFFRDYMGVDDPLRLKRQRLVEKAQTIAEEAALKASAALFQRVMEPVGAEAMAQTGLDKFAPPPNGGAPPPNGGAPPPNGVYTGNGAGGSVPLAPAPTPQAEMAAVGAGGVAG
jgi:hypothetical protein